MRGLKFLVILVVLALVLGAVGACSSDDETTTPTESTTPTEKVPTGTLTYLSDYFGLSEWGPWSQVAEGGRQYVNIVSDYLTYATKDTRELRPGLATKWEISEDQTSVHFWLREGVQFHKGYGEMTSEDVKFTYDASVMEGATGYVWRTVAPLVDRVETDGRYELTVYCKGPYAGFVPYWFSDYTGNTIMIPITSKKYVEEVGIDEANSWPVFTGPYELVEKEDFQYAIFEAVENHWRVVPEYKQIILKSIPEESTRVAMLKRGEGDIIACTSSTAVMSEAAEVGKIVAVKDAIGLYMALFGQFLTTDPGYDPSLPWLDKKVREAMSLAIDREAIAESIFSGYARPASLPVFMPWENEFEVVPYDPDRAKELLKEAGYEDGFTVEMWPLVYSMMPPEIYDVTQAVAGYWEAIGLHCNIRFLNIMQAYPKWFAHMTAGVACPLPGLIQLQPYETIFADAFYSKRPGIGIYLNPELDKLVDQALALPEGEERTNLAKEMCRFIVDEYAIVPLMYTDTTFLVNPDTVGEWPVIPGSNMVFNLEYIRHPTPLGTFRLFEP